ncbi:MAG: Mrp/NBP35 family ATP-binding protein, partial [Bacteroidia bacterium]|nr:Mrp/NBP35 family ATP-binding protein [Bacteroidia bacterium]
ELPGRKFYLFGKDGGKQLASEFSLPFLGQIPLVETIRESGDKGIPCSLDSQNPISVAFKQFAGEVARQVAIQNARLNSY